MRLPPAKSKLSMLGQNHLMYNSTLIFGELLLWLRDLPFIGC